ncbi:hypothetical protein UlMin_036544 [Ulmus minor]
MDKVLLVFLLFTHFSLSIAQQKVTQISLGSSLSPNTNNSFLLSNSGQFAFGFYEEGNGFAIGIWFQQIREKTVIWTANRDNQPVPSSTNLVFSHDGRLFLQDKQGVRTPVFDSSQPAASASMLDSGNFVLYNSNSTIIWQSFDVPTHTLLSGQRLASGKELVSGVSETNHSSGRFQLIMQMDGNLVQYPTNIQPAPYYAYRRFNTSKFGGKDSVSLNLDPTGELKLVNSSGVKVRKIVAGRSQLGDKVVYRLTLDADGILRLYSHSLVQNASWMILWTSTTNRCDPIGLCGLNSYCVLIEQEPRCTCPPGFDFLDQSQKNLGCKRNTSFNGCTTKDGIEVSVAEINGVRWADNSYSPVLFMNETACKEECLRDCNCEFALFRNDRCRKQMFPLRFSRNRRSDVVRTIIKVHNGSSGATTTKVSKERNGKVRTGIFISILGVSGFGLLLLVIFGFVIYIYRRRDYNRISNLSIDGLLEDVTLRSYSYVELENATNGFTDQVGRGSFGTVFKGTISNSWKVVAIKRLEKLVTDGEREFKTEIRAISRTHHRNLVKLLGYCYEQDSRLLVYEFMTNGSLADYFFKSESKPNWEERIGIALNVAKGIVYLHEECDTQIIHCDIKPENILMDEQKCPKIADFGLAKLLMPDQTGTFTGFRGTRGYVAPEWHRNMPITVKADVYSFGITLLEIVFGRRCVDMEVPEEKIVLANWVYDCFLDGELDKLVEDEEEVDKIELQRTIKIGLWCIQDEPFLRPSMKKVVLMLEGTIEVAAPPSPISSISIVQVD